MLGTKIFLKSDSLWGLIQTNYPTNPQKSRTYANIRHSKFESQIDNSIIKLTSKKQLLKKFLQCVWNNVSTEQKTLVKEHHSSLWAVDFQHAATSNIYSTKKRDRRIKRKKFLVEIRNDIFYIWSATFDISAENNQTARGIHWSECTFHFINDLRRFLLNQKGEKVG